nr:hypothetical protein [Sphingorhabdus sp.]
MIAKVCEVEGEDCFFISASGFYLIPQQRRSRETTTFDPVVVVVPSLLRIIKHFSLFAQSSLFANVWFRRPLFGILTTKNLSQSAPRPRHPVLDTGLGF